MRKNFLPLCVLIFGVSFPLGAGATSLFGSEGPSLNRKVRNLGMGNVGVALRGTTDSSPFYNPAGLNDVEKGRFQIMTITGDVSSNAIGLIGDVKQLSDDIDKATTDAQKVDVLDKFIQSRTGEFDHVRLSLDLINYARKNFAAGLVIDERLDASFRDQIFPHFDMQNVGDVSLYFAGSHGFWDKILQVGLTLRPTIRFALNEADQQITFSDVVAKNAAGDSIMSDKFKRIQDRRFGLGVDLGLKSDLKLPLWKDAKWYTFLKPQVGATWQDIGSPSFDTAVGNQQSISLGVAIHPDWWKLKNAVALDLRGINQEKDFLTKLHFGLETTFDFPVSVSVRGGLSEGYLSGGATFDLWLVKLDAAIYYEEVGVVTRQAGDLRYAATLSFNI